MADHKTKHTVVQFVVLGEKFLTPPLIVIILKTVL